MIISFLRPIRSITVSAAIVATRFMKPTAMLIWKAASVEAPAFTMTTGA